MSLEPKSEPAFAVTISNGHFSVMAVQGSFNLGVADGNEYPGLPGFWWLARLKVHDRHQGQGIGPQLLKQVFEIFRLRDGFEGLFVAPGGYGSDVRKLERFYEAQGFVKQRKEEGLLMLWRPSHLPLLLEEPMAAKKKVVKAKAAPKKAVSSPKLNLDHELLHKMSEALINLSTSVQMLHRKVDLITEELAKQQEEIDGEDEGSEGGEAEVEEVRAEGDVPEAGDDDFDEDNGGDEDASDDPAADDNT